jgi:hypothetical protein
VGEVRLFRRKTVGWEEGCLVGHVLIQRFKRSSLREFAIQPFKDWGLRFEKVGGWGKSLVLPPIDGFTILFRIHF